MKQIAIALLLSVAANAQAYTTCTNANGTFSLEITNSQVVVTDKSAFSGPATYACVATVLADTNKVTLYNCANEEKQVAIYVNETLNAGQYQDLSNENNERGNLSCQTQN